MFGNVDFLPMANISPQVDRQEKNICELCRGPLEVPSRVSRTSLSLKLTKLRPHELWRFSRVKIRPKPVNGVKCPLGVPPGEKLF